jgi:hypothetical protein
LRSDLDPRRARLHLCGLAGGVALSEVAALQLPFAIGFISIIGALLVMPTSLLVAPLGVKVARFHQAEA